jgi:hypothetical protein
VSRSNAASRSARGRRLPAPGMSRKLKWSGLVAACAVALSLGSSASSQPSPRNSPVRFDADRIVGNIDGINQDGARTYIAGWACQRGQNASIAVHVYAGNSAGDPSQRTLVVAGQANRASEPAIDESCRDHDGGHHRFLILLPPQFVADSENARLYVHGIRVMDSVPNDAIARSGTRLADLPGFTPPHPAFPALSGVYRGLVEHPRVFTTQAELSELASRINRSGSYSSRRFGQLTGQIARDLAATNDWDATYTGCDLTPYTYAFSYEPQDADTATRLRSTLRLGPNVTPPAGAAVVASRLALYAALVKAGAALPAGAPRADQAAELAKRILLAWSDRGFRDPHGHYLSMPSQFCDETGKTGEATETGVGLAIARGVIYSVHAQDLLMYSGAITPEEAKRLEAFHAAMYELIRNALNYNFASHHAWACDHYSNHAANQLAGLLATARLLDDKKRFDAALSGTEPSISVTLPWTAYFDRAVYGDNDLPNACYANSGTDGATSRPFFQATAVAAGEIDDRYRNAHPAQGIGYPMFTLERLFDMAEILRIAGFDSYSYRGRHQQSIEMAIGYYACLAKAAGFSKTLTAENAGACPDAAQYFGKIVSGVDSNVVFGAYRFPANHAITDMEGSAKISASSGAFSLDAIFFGRWRD